MAAHFYAIRLMTNKRTYKGLSTLATNCCRKWQQSCQCGQALIYTKNGNAIYDDMAYTGRSDRHGDRRGDHRGDHRPVYTLQATGRRDDRQLVARLHSVYTRRSSPQRSPRRCRDSCLVYTLQATDRRDDRSDSRGDDRPVYTPYEPGEI